MSPNLRISNLSARKVWPAVRAADKLLILSASALVSCALLGGVLALFEARSNEAVLAHAPGKPQPSNVGLAAIKVASGLGG